MKTRKEFKDIKNYPKYVQKLYRKEQLKEKKSKEVLGE